MLTRSFEAIKKEILGRKYELSLVFATPQKIQKLNKIYRNINKPTDILSFPLSKTSGEIFICKDEAKKEIAKRSRFTPRTANYLLKRSRDLAQVRESKLSKETVMEALNLLGIDEMGLNATDRALLTVIEEKFNGGPVGLNTLAAALSEEQATIEDVYEPYLLQLGFIERTSRGRTITERAKKHLGLKNKNKLL